MSRTHLRRKTHIRRIELPGLCDFACHLQRVRKGWPKWLLLCGDSSCGSSYDKRIDFSSLMAEMGMGGFAACAFHL